MVTRQDLHALFYEALESGEWSPEELHDEVDETARSWELDKAEDESGG